MTALVLGACSSSASGSEMSASERHAIIDRGIVAAQAGDLGAAEASFRQVLAADPNDGMAHFNMGSIFIDRAGAAFAGGDEPAARALATQALTHFDQSLSAEPPGSPLALLLSSRILLKFGRTAEAESRLQRFLDEGHGNAPQRGEARTLLHQATRQPEAPALPTTVPER